MTANRREYKENRKRKESERENLPREVFNEKKKKFNIPNRLSNLGSVDEELAERQNAIEDTIKVYRELMPTILNRLKNINDYRNPKKLKHKLAVLMVYGVFMFVFQYSSRRKTNLEISKPIFFENLKHLFPEIETMPHGDTLGNVLEIINVDEIQDALVCLFQKMIRNKKFRNYLYNKRYLLAMDGTQKHSSDIQWDEKWLTKCYGKGDEKKERYSVFILECVFIMDNGVTLPLYSEFLSNEDFENGKSKQDCETKAFYRLANKIKKQFPKLKISVTIDGIYANGPIIRYLRRIKWDFMITFKEGSMSEAFNEAMKLIDYVKENRLEKVWADREQLYRWINKIEYRFGAGERFVEYLNVVVCYETWEEISRQKKKITKHETRYVWISNVEITEKNVFKRCTLMGRYRWHIENNFLVMKHGGYNYKHFYSFNWNAMKGYHYLMNIGRFVNVIALNTELIKDRWVKKMGINPYLKFLRDICKAALLDFNRIDEIVAKKNYIKLAS
jgi:DDE_Tnp_1-associated